MYKVHSLLDNAYDNSYKERYCLTKEKWIEMIKKFNFDMIEYLPVGES